jgi:hypothetical protein
VKVAFGDALSADIVPTIRGVTAYLTAGMRNRVKG